MRMKVQLPHVLTVIGLFLVAVTNADKVPTCKDLHAMKATQNYTFSNDGEVATGPIQCTFKITVKEGSGVKIRFDEFDLGTVGEAAKNYIEIRSAGKTNAKPVFKGTNVTKSQVYSVAENAMEMEVKLEKLDAKKGFIMEYYSGARGLVPHILAIAMVAFPVAVSFLG
ncbi:unnamed protein product [Calicophoron daubneyi]|uniref:CUB domain-containing protein n=1 Tax=Calicophoron daubneyi TaxID=300641 RepID=A0AAV2SVG2_CALDB